MPSYYWLEKHSGAVVQVDRPMSEHNIPPHIIEYCKKENVTNGAWEDLKRVHKDYLYVFGPELEWSRVFLPPNSNVAPRKS